MPDDVQWPPHITVDDALALDELAAAGVGEGDFGEDHAVPAHLLELYEGIEYTEAVGDQRDESERHADEDAWHGRYGQ